MPYDSLVSIIIPTKNSVKTINLCLDSIANQTYPYIEIIIVDSQSYDGTLELIRNFYSHSKMILLETKQGRAGARNIGFEHSNGSYICSIDSDMVLNPHIIQSCVNKILAGYDSVILPEISVGFGFWAKAKMLEKKCYIGDELIEASRFFKREIFEKLNGYCSQLEYGEDWDLHQRIIYSGYHVGRTHYQIKHLEGNIRLKQIFLQKYNYGKTAKHYWKRHPDRAKSQIVFIRPAFLRNWKMLGHDPLHSSGLFFMKFCELIGGFLGFVSSF